MRTVLRSATMLVSVLLIGLGVYGQEPVRYTLRYQPEVGSKCPTKLAGVLLDAAFQGQSLGVSGDVSADLVSEATERDEEARTTTLKLTIGGIKANLNGQISAPEAPAPLKLVVGETGSIVGVKSDEETSSAVSFLDTGGVPVVMVAMLATTVRFPDEAVAVGESWEIEDTYVVPGLGEVPINTHWQLAAMEGAEAAITSTAIAALPDFSTPNPMVPGTRMDVKAGRAYITDVKQVYDTAASRVTKSEGKLRIDAQLDMQGMTVPVSLVMSFCVKPPERTDAEPAANP